MWVSLYNWCDSHDDNIICLKTIYQLLPHNKNCRFTIFLCLFVSLVTPDHTVQPGAFKSSLNTNHLIILRICFKYEKIALFHFSLRFICKSFILIYDFQRKKMSYLFDKNNRKFFSLSFNIIWKKINFLSTLLLFQFKENFWKNCFQIITWKIILNFKSSRLNCVARGDKIYIQINLLRNIYNTYIFMLKWP